MNFDDNVLNMKNTVRELQNKGICPSCYNFEYGVIYEDFRERLVY